MVPKYTRRSCFNLVYGHESWIILLTKKMGKTFLKKLI